MSTEDLEKVPDPEVVFARETGRLLPDLAEQAVTYQRWHARNVVAAADMVSGLAASNAIAMKRYLDKQIEILENPAAALEGLQPEVAAAVVSAASDGFIKGSDILRRQALDAVKAAETMLKVKKNTGGEKGGPKKPGFGKKARPVAIKAEAGSTVVLNTADTEGDTQGPPA